MAGEECPADHSWCAQTETWVTVAAKNRVCCPELRIGKSVMKMLCPRDLVVVHASRRGSGSRGSPAERDP